MCVCVAFEFIDKMAICKQVAHLCFASRHKLDGPYLIMPPPRRGGGGIKRSSASVRLSDVAYIGSRKPKGLGRRNFAQGYPRSHATPTPTSRSKVKVSRGGGILWRPPSRTACSSGSLANQNSAVPATYCLS